MGRDYVAMKFLQKELRLEYNHGTVNRARLQNWAFSDLPLCLTSQLKAQRTERRKEEEAFLRPLRP